jgi:hypothetical protein
MKYRSSTLPARPEKNSGDLKKKGGQAAAFLVQRGQRLTFAFPAPFLISPLALPLAPGFL